MKKSLLALMLAIALVSLTACGSKVKEPEATATPVVTEAPTAEPTEEPTAEPTEAPTAEPTDARMNPQRVEKLLTFFFFIDSLSTGKPACFPVFTKFYYFKALL